MSEELVYDPKKGLGPLDRVMLKAAASGKSPNEISEATNGIVKPAAAAQRIRDILGSRDWLSVVERKALLVDDMYMLKDQLQAKVTGFEGKDHTKPLISILTLLEKTLAADKLDVAAAMAQIDKAHAQLMLDAISLALERSLLELEKRHPDIAKGELMTVFHEAMPEVVQSIESRVAA